MRASGQERVSEEVRRPEFRIAWRSGRPSYGRDVLAFVPKQRRVHGHQTLLHPGAKRDSGEVTGV